MPDLQWDEVRPFFDPELMGTLPDVVIEETGVEDWQAPAGSDRFARVGVCLLRGRGRLVLFQPPQSCSPVRM
jgi:hypothetical protein